MPSTPNDLRSLANHADNEAIKALKRTLDPDSIGTGEYALRMFMCANELRARAKMMDDGHAL